MRPQVSSHLGPVVATPMEMVYEITTSRSVQIGLQDRFLTSGLLTSTGVVYGVADPDVTVSSGARRVGVN
jgi:hypothetical protein